MQLDFGRRKIDSILMPSGMKGSRTNCVNMQKKNPTHLPEDACNFHPHFQHLHEQDAQPIAGSDVREPRAETVASTGPIHTELLQHIAGVTLSTLRTSTAPLSSPCNLLLPGLLHMMMVLMEALSAFDVLHN